MNREQRSEKVRELLDDMPRGLTVVGFCVIVLILIALVCAVTIIPYPYSYGESILTHILQRF